MKQISLSPEVQNKAVLYCRFSSENQREESIEGQRRECLEYAQKNGIEVIGEYVDRAKSATTDERPDFQRMIRESSSKSFGIVLVWKLDRFARNRFDSLKYKAILKQNGVRLLSATERIMEGSDGIIMESLLDGMNEYYSADLSQKVKRGMTENVLKGKTTGGLRQFGYQIVDGRYVIDENEGHMVREMFHLYAYDGLSIKAIWEKFNALGYLRTEGKKIQRSTLEKALSSERYIGVLKCEGQRNENAIPRLVDDDTFYKAQERREKRKHVGGAYQADIEYSLTGKVFCAECGEMLVGESGTSKSKKLYSYYHCKGARAKRCKLPRAIKEDLEMVVSKLVLEALTDKQTLKDIADCIYKTQDRDSTELVALKEQLSKVQERLDNFAKAIGMGIITDTTKSSLVRLEAEKADIEKRIQRENITHRRYTKHEILASLEIMNEYLSESDIQKRSLFETFVEKVYVHQNGKVTVNIDIFGTRASIESIDDVLNSVRTEKLELRQSNLIRTFFAWQSGFVAIGQLPKRR